MISYNDEIDIDFPHGVFAANRKTSKTTTKYDVFAVVAKKYLCIGTIAVDNDGVIHCFRLKDSYSDGGKYAWNRFAENASRCFTLPVQSFSVYPDSYDNDSHLI